MTLTRFFRFRKQSLRLLCVRRCFLNQMMLEISDEVRVRE